MTWNASLALDYTRHADKTVARFRHDGPLRILQSLYPEGEAICHNVIVHPPGGLVGGDTLDLTFTVGAHGLVTTPGATRFYRSQGEPALMRARSSKPMPCVPRPAPPARTGRSWWGPGLGAHGGAGHGPAQAGLESLARPFLEPGGAQPANLVCLKRSLHTFA